MSSNSQKEEPQQTTNEEIFLGYQRLMMEQSDLAQKLSELEFKLNQHRDVIETLEEAEDDRKCFRMVGEVLCEGTVREMLPALKSTKQEMETLATEYKQQLAEKEKELEAYKEKHNIVTHGPHAFHL